MEFQKEQSTFAVDNQYMIGDVFLHLPPLFRFLHLSVLHSSGGALLACPVTDPGVQEVKVLLPGSGEVTESES